MEPLPMIFRAFVSWFLGFAVRIGMGRIPLVAKWKHRLERNTNQRLIDLGIRLNPIPDDLAKLITDLRVLEEEQTWECFVPEKVTADLIHRNQRARFRLSELLTG